MSARLDTERVTRAMLEAERPVRRGQQGRTENLRRTGKRHLAILSAENPEPYSRPKTYGECQSVGLGTLVPCPFVGCAHHLYLDVDDRFTPSLSVKLNFPGKEPDELAETCALVVAERGQHVFLAIAPLLNLTRERTRQIEHSAMAAMAGSRLVQSLAGVSDPGEPTEGDDGSGAATDADAVDGLAEFSHDGKGWRE